MLFRPGWSNEQIDDETDRVIAMEDDANRRGQQASAELNATLEAAWRCVCCGRDSAAFDADALCRRRRAVIAEARAERLGTEVIDGATRRQLAEQYLDRQATP